MVRARGRKLFLVLYAAFGPLLLQSLYIYGRHSWRGNTQPFDIPILVVAVVSGAVCAFQGLPGSRLVRACVTVVYLASMTALALFAGLFVDCSQGNCDPWAN
jgi:hypothetical protein